MVVIIRLRHNLATLKDTETAEVRFITDKTRFVRKTASNWWHIGEPAFRQWDSSAKWRSREKRNSKHAMKRSNEKYLHEYIIQTAYDIPSPTAGRLVKWLRYHEDVEVGSSWHGRLVDCYTV